VSVKSKFSHEEIQPGRGLPGGRAGEASVLFAACATILRFTERALRESAAQGIVLDAGSTVMIEARKK
jgi:hypothetical protein